jgi:hypothetical protein
VPLTGLSAAHAGNRVAAPGWLRITRVLLLEAAGSGTLASSLRAGSASTCGRCSEYGAFARVASDRAPLRRSAGRFCPAGGSWTLSRMPTHDVRVVVAHFRFVVCRSSFASGTATLRPVAMKYSSRLSSRRRAAACDEGLLPRRELESVPVPGDTKAEGPVGHTT